MRRTRSLARLFEARAGEGRRASPGRTAASELEAVQAGRKAIAMFPLARPGEVPADDAFLRRLLGAATARGLGVLVEPDAQPPLAGVPRGVIAFAIAPGEGWRVPALAVLWRAARESGAWSDAAERQQSDLLGYSAAERAAWLAELRHRAAGWGARTVYALLDGARVDAIDQLGRRCFGPPAAIEGLVFFVHGRGHPPRRDAARRAPRGFAIARAAIAEPARARLFGGRTGRGVIEAVATARAAAAIAAGLRSSVELLTARGWR
jgi:hypothetical protein